MVDEGGLVKVLDFGLAKLTESHQSREAESTRTLQPHTRKGIVGHGSVYVARAGAGKAR
jgi:hypothetical protein